MTKVFVFDPTISDQTSSYRGIGRYLQILKENFPSWHYINKLEIRNLKLEIFINPFFNFLQPPLTLRRIAKRQIAIIHDLIPLKYPAHFPSGIKGKINIFLNKMALANYDTIITDSQSSKNDIVKILNIDEKKVKVIYPCLPKIFSQNTQINADEKQITQISAKSVFQSVGSASFCLYVGDVTWNKNLVNLAKAIKIINVTCVFVGKIFDKKATGVEGGGIPTARSRGVLFERAPAGGNPRQAPSLNHPWQQEFKEFLNETKNDKRFIFLGFINDYRLIKLYQQARVNILPSRDEGFGFSYLEAASQKCPSILADIRVLREIAGDSAWFADPEDPYDLANKIGEVYFNNNLRNDLAKKSEKRAQFFSREKFKNEFLKFMRQV